MHYMVEFSPKKKGDHMEVVDTILHSLAILGMSLGVSSLITSTLIIASIVTNEIVSHLIEKVRSSMGWTSPKNEYDITIINSIITLIIIVSTIVITIQKVLE